MMCASGQEQIERNGKVGLAGVVPTVLVNTHKGRSRRWKGSIRNRIASTQLEKDELGNLGEIKSQTAFNHAHPGVPKRWGRFP
jgi:hypothetical protein